MDTLRKAEERSREAARRLERALGLEDKGRVLRRRMRVVPGTTPATQEASTPVKHRTPIISINGKDVPVEAGKDRRTA